MKNIPVDYILCPSVCRLMKAASDLAGFWTPESARWAVDYDPTPQPRPLTLADARVGATVRFMRPQVADGPLGPPIGWTGKITRVDKSDDYPIQVVGGRGTDRASEAWWCSVASLDLIAPAPEGQG